MRFCEAEPGTPPDAWGTVVRLDDDGSCALLFGELTILDYAPGVIQQGIADGSIVVREKSDFFHDPYAGHGPRRYIDIDEEK